MYQFSIIIFPKFEHEFIVVKFTDAVDRNLFIVHKFEKEFTVVKFTDKEDGDEDPEFSKQLKNCDGRCLIVNHKHSKCEFCESHRCDRTLYREELVEFLE